MADFLNQNTPGVSVSPYPVDLQQEAASNSRRRAIADLLLAQALRPVQQPTGPGGMPVPMSPFAALQPLAAGIVGAISHGKADQGDKDIAARYSSGLAGAVADLQTKMQSGDYAGAAATAQRYPALKAISEKLMERQLPKFGVHEGVAVDENARDPLATARPIDPRVPINQTITSPSGTTTIPGTRGAVTGKEAFPPANILNVQNFPENTLATEAAKGQANLLYGEKGALPQSRATAESAQKDLSILANVNDLAQNARFGSFQEFRNNLSKIAETAGFSTTKDASGSVISSTDNMLRQLAGRSLEVAKKLGSGSGFSDRDLAFLQSIQAGKDLDEGGMRKFMELAFESDVKAIHQHNSSVETAPEALPGFKRSYRVEIPADIDAMLQKGLKLGPPTSYEKAATPPQGPIPAASLTPAQLKALQDYINSQQQPQSQTP